jgi:hypothetical protein
MASPNREENGWAFGGWGMFQRLVNAPWMSFNAALSLLPLPTPQKKKSFLESVGRRGNGGIMD